MQLQRIGSTVFKMTAWASVAQDANALPTRFASRCFTVSPCALAARLSRASNLQIFTIAVADDSKTPQCRRIRKAVNLISRAAFCIP